MPASEPELDPVHAFAVVAREFCALVTEDQERAVSSRRLAKSIARLIERGLDLPADMDEDMPAPSSEAAPEDGSTRSGLAVLSSVVYFDVFDPLADPPAEPVGNSLLDDVGDTYADIKRGLALYDAGHIRRAAWEWRFSFWIHWGEHASGALRALYWTMRNAGDTE